jgi:hypothetical protein
MTDETPPGDADETKGKAKAAPKLLPRDWLEIVQMARAGVPVSTIADKFHVKRASVYAGLKKRRVVIGGLTPSSAEIEDSTERQELIKRIRETKDLDYRYTEFIQKTSVNLLMQAKKEDRPLSTTLDDQKALDIALKIIKNGTQNKWMILGLDRDNEDTDKELPELPIREMSQDEIVATRDQQLLDDAEMEDLEASLAAGDELGDLEDGELDEDEAT